MRCPHCGETTPVESKLERARDQVESLTLDAERLAWCAERAYGVNPQDELELFRIQFRRSEYRLSAGRGGLVRNGWAAFQYHMLQAVKFSKPRSGSAQVANRPKKYEPKDV